MNVRLKTEFDQFLKRKKIPPKTVKNRPVGVFCPLGIRRVHKKICDKEQLHILLSWRQLCFFVGGGTCLQIYSKDCTSVLPVTLHLRGTKRDCSVETKLVRPCVSQIEWTERARCVSVADIGGHSSGSSPGSSIPTSPIIGHGPTQSFFTVPQHHVRRRRRVVCVSRTGHLFVAREP